MESDIENGMQHKRKEQCKTGFKTYCKTKRKAECEMELNQERKTNEKRDTK